MSRSCQSDSGCSWIDIRDVIDKHQYLARRPVINETLQMQPQVERTTLTRTIIKYNLNIIVICRRAVGGCQPLSIRSCFIDKRERSLPNSNFSFQNFGTSAILFSKACQGVFSYGQRTKNESVCSK